MARSRLAGVVADCFVCEWKAFARNAMGLAAQHTNRTGHRTGVNADYVLSPDIEASKIAAPLPTVDGLAMTGENDGK